MDNLNYESYINNISHEVIKKEKENCIEIYWQDDSRKWGSIAKAVFYSV